MIAKNQTSILGIGIAIFLLISSCTNTKTQKFPEKWCIAGDQPKSYLMGTNSRIVQSGCYSATIKSIDDEIEGFGTLMQQCSPNVYKGKRVRMSSYMKSEEVTDSSGFWFRVDVDSVSVSFDNMQISKDARPVLGTTDWRKYEIVLDVPTNATCIAYGALLCGTGQIWFDNLTFEVVDKTVSTTGITDTCSIQNGRRPRIFVAEPANLDFEKAVYKRNFCCKQ